MILWALFVLGSTTTGCNRQDPSLAPVAATHFAEPPPALRDLGRSDERHVFWGDLHIHTSYSFDAYTLGVRALPDDAYAFAKGETIQHALGYPIRSSRPLDFAAVTDHAEFLGSARLNGMANPEANTDLPAVMNTGSPLRITWNYLRTTMTKMRNTEVRTATFASDDDSSARSAWEDTVGAAQRHNQPGRFTTFVAYEWTSMPDDENLHRNIIYRSKQVPELPFSSLDSDNPEDLWRALDLQRRVGMEMISIPHNGNVSNGRMYDEVGFDGTTLDPAYAALRMRNEPLSEVFQVKGSSETHPAISPEDSFAGFEIFDQLLGASLRQSEPRGSYARDALRRGLEMSAAHGFNPYQFGFIGSSDSHNASSSVEEDNYHGKLPMIDGTSGLRIGETLLLPIAQNRALRWGAAGLAGVWATENTRDALYEAMLRKETYATSGPRMTVRFFGSRQYTSELLQKPNRIRKAYADGVAMGGTIASGDRPPSFFVSALKDPEGANLDRIQIIKGWVDSTGKSHEAIFDIAGSGGRIAATDTHRMTDVGNTVSIETATYTNTIGAASLESFWTDPDYHPEQEAFYYARVIEIPTPRWSTYDAVAWDVEAPQPSSIQERAITSAIWVPALKEAG